jgi:putative phosphoesterase
VTIELLRPGVWVSGETGGIVIDDGTAPSARETPSEHGAGGRAPETGLSAEEREPEATRPSRVRIGVIADAHGHLDPRVTRIFAGVDQIIAAGDMVDPEVLTSLAGIAPVTAVRGPSDADRLAASLPEEATGEVGDVGFAVGHSSDRLLRRLSAGSIPTGSKDSMPDLVVWAGTHKPAVDWIGGSLFLNPGTARSPDPEDNDPTVAIVEGRSGALTVRFVPLRRGPAKKPQKRKVLGFRGGFVPTIMEREVSTSRRRRGEK